MKKYALLTAVLLGSSSFALAAGSNVAPRQTAAQQDFRGAYGAYGCFDDYGCMGRNGGMPRIFYNLNLTAAQQTKIRAIIDAERPDPMMRGSREDVRQRMLGIREQEERLLSAKNFDEQAARTVIEARRKEREAADREFAEHDLRRLKMHHAVFQVLTPAQQKQYLQNRAQMFQRGMQPQTDTPVMRGRGRR